MTFIQDDLTRKMLEIVLKYILSQSKILSFLSYLARIISDVFNISFEYILYLMI